VHLKHVLLVGGLCEKANPENSFFGKSAFNTPFNQYTPLTSDFENVFANPESSK
jgi:hypothetical protein